MLVRLATILVALSLGGACSHDAAEQPAMVFAAASLTAPFQAIVKAFEQQHPGEHLELHLAGTPELVLQVREGAAADVLASADTSNMQKIVAAGQAASAPTIFAKNRLTIVAAKGNPKGIRSLADLAAKDLKVALCGPEVPAGRYARQALAKAAVTVASVSDEPSVKSIVSKVQLGELDAGIVYVTDAAAAADQTAAVRIPDEHNVVASYPIALLSTGKSRASGEALVAFVLGAQGQRILQSFGFQSP